MAYRPPLKDGELPPWLTRRHLPQTHYVYHGTSRESAAEIMQKGFIESPIGLLGRGIYGAHDRAEVKITPVNDLTWRSDYDAVYSIAANIHEMCFKEEVVQSVSISTDSGREWLAVRDSERLIWNQKSHLVLEREEPSAAPIFSPQRSHTVQNSTKRPKTPPPTPPVRCRQIHFAWLWRILFTCGVLWLLQPYHQAAEFAHITLDFLNGTSFDLLEYLYVILASVFDKLGTASNAGCLTLCKTASLAMANLPSRDEAAEILDIVAGTMNRVRLAWFEGGYVLAVIFDELGIAGNAGCVALCKAANFAIAGLFSHDQALDFWPDRLYLILSVSFDEVGLAANAGCVALRKAANFAIAGLPFLPDRLYLILSVSFDEVGLAANAGCVALCKAANFAIAGLPSHDQALDFWVMTVECLSMLGKALLDRLYLTLSVSFDKVGIAANAGCVALCKAANFAIAGLPSRDQALDFWVMTVECSRRLGKALLDRLHPILSVSFDKVGIAANAGCVALCKAANFALALPSQPHAIELCDLTAYFLSRLLDSFYWILASAFDAGGKAANAAVVSLCMTLHSLVRSFRYK
ncbi:unnamed protein product [Effrenium voratum]|uniref:PARP catalytic domain-containing protein n=1 Tax=Effrenium voratum TaxID=2562239 RepID=A0AA36MI49_9DINO|nr:unnamed protein product [Effrenium voratum]CAJ1431701.1 unnamed protein product [Effrenium voratum]